MSHGAVPVPERIVLIGFMGAGKTTVGRRLARRLGWSFVDFDERVRERTGRSAGQLIREAGEARLRRLEADITDEVAGTRQLVLAPGGGWAARPELAERLGSGTVRIWLRVGPEVAVRRCTAEAVDRPLLGPPDGRLERARRLLRERERYYRQAELNVDVDERDPDVVVAEIIRRLGLDLEDDER